MMGVWRRSTASALAVVVAASSGAASAASAPAKTSPEADAPAEDEDTEAEAGPDAGGPDLDPDPDPDPEEAADAGPPTPAGDAADPDAVPPQLDEPVEDDAAADEPAAPHREPPEPTAPDPGLWSVRVRIVGGAPGELELFKLDPEERGERAGSLGGIPYTRVCRDPCDDRVAVDPNDRLFVAGPKVMPSKTFALETGASEVELRVRPGPKAIRFAGFGLTVSGALLIPGGGLLVGAVDRGAGPDIAGFTLIGVGVVSLAVGIGLLVRGRTLVKVQ